MTKKILLAGVLGGLVIFIWSALSHMVFGLGDAGIRTFPDEAQMIAAIREGVPEPGFYFFPGMDTTRKLSAEEQKQWEEKYSNGPTGIMILQPKGSDPMMARQLPTELASNIFCALIAACLLSQTLAAGGTFLGRVGFVALLGLFASVTIDVSYWNWYAFPASYTLSVMADAVIGHALAGLVLAAIVKPRAV